MSLFIVPSRSRYSLLSQDDDATSQVSVPKPSSVRIPRAIQTFQPGQICIVQESVFTPICDVLQDAFGPLDPRTGASLTAQSGKVVPVSSGKERPCIIMDAPSHLSSRRNTKKGYFICLMATFAASGGQYERLGKLFQRFVVPIEPNAQLLPDSNMYALKTIPTWRHPWQWAISVIIYTTQPMKLYTPCNGKARRLSHAEYNRLAQHCATQRLLWESDTQRNRSLKEEMYDEVVVGCSILNPMCCALRTDTQRTGNLTQLTLTMRQHIPAVPHCPSTASSQHVPDVVVEALRRCTL
ncbi:hypothetical protein IW261DRAFT_995943 [Armillaria novae-zelandiae]|uniref:Uncharacterized protein n=1 Tax=Armillaria novae-zelandiae TaxID=153914 RepID=A0AA39UEL8_9AGAR|nr:hypothetical protein IW261DRAFT_995943 [Armillaria novae-zelandiae]